MVMEMECLTSDISARNTLGGGGVFLHNYPIAFLRESENLLKQISVLEFAATWRITE